MMKWGHGIRHASVSQAALEADGPLTWRGEHHFRVEDLCRLVGPPEPGQARDGQQYRFELPLVQTPDASVDVASQVRNQKVRPRCA
jgi:hypothetical protein